MMTLETFDTEVVTHYRTMYRVALSLMQSPDDAADAVQDAMGALWDSRDKLGDVRDMRAYCLRVVRNRCLEHLRRNEPVVGLSDVVESSLEAGDVGVEELRDELRCVASAIDALPDMSRRVLRMNAYGGCSGREIAEATGLSEANVRAILSRTRKRLRSLFSN